MYFQGQDPHTIGEAWGDGAVVCTYSVGVGCTARLGHRVSMCVYVRTGAVLLCHACKGAVRVLLVEGKSVWVLFYFLHLLLRRLRARSGVIKRPNAKRLALLNVRVNYMGLCFELISVDLEADTASGTTLAAESLVYVCTK